MNTERIFNTSLTNLKTENKGKTDSKLSENMGIDSTDNELIQTDYFKTISSIIELLENTGTLVGSSGYCLAISDLLQKILNNEGIGSHLVECELSYLHKKTKKLFMVGIDRNFHYSPDIKNTHVVLITDTEIPILIDLSISHIDERVRFICRRLNEGTSDSPCVAEYNIGDAIWTYHKKERVVLPYLHEQSIVNRIKQDKIVKNKIHRINTLLFLMALVTTLNFSRGIFDFYQKYLNKDNGFGPQPSLVK